MMRNVENKNYRFVSFLSDAQKKIPKKLKKLKNTIENSFEVKIGWRRMRKRENKIIVPFCSYPTRNRKFQKNKKKIQKVKKYQCGLIISQNRFEKAGKERK